MALLFLLFFALDLLHAEVSFRRYTTIRRRRNPFAFVRAAAAAAAALARVTLLACFSLRTRSFVWTSSRTMVATSWRISAHSGSVEAYNMYVKKLGKYTHLLLCWPMFWVCQAHTNEDRRLLSSLPIQHGKRQGHSPASSILFQLHQTILRTPCQCEL